MSGVEPTATAGSRRRVLVYARQRPGEDPDTLGQRLAQITTETERKGWRVVAQVAAPVPAGMPEACLERLAEVLRGPQDGEEDVLVVACLDDLATSVNSLTALPKAVADGGGVPLAGNRGMEATPRISTTPSPLPSVDVPQRVDGQDQASSACLWKTPDDVCEQIAARRMEGQTYPEIAEHLNASGVPTTHRASRWTEKTVRDVHKRYQRRQAASVESGSTQPVAGPSGGGGIEVSTITVFRPPFCVSITFPW